MNVSVGAGIKNKFTFHVDDIKTGEHREYEGHNIVLDTMWSRLVNFQPFFVNIHFGTGTGAFNDKTRAGLYTYLGTKPATTEFQTRDLPTSTWRRKIVLNPEEYVGQTITEVGVAYGSAAANLVTHAAPKDAEGNPISIGPKKDTEIITIYADMYFVLAENMYGGKIKWVTPLANNELLSYLMGANYPTQWFRVGASNLDGDGVVISNLGQSTTILPANWTKDSVNKKAITPVTRLGTAVGNGKIIGYGLGSSDVIGTFKAQFPIPTVFTSTAMSENIGSGDGSKVGYNPTWSFANVSVVKVDGVTVETYDISETKKGTNLLLYKNVRLLAGSSTPSYANLVDGKLDTFSSFPTGTEIGIDVGVTGITVDSFRIYATFNHPSSDIQIWGSDNADFSDSVLLGKTANIVSGQWHNVSITSAAYRYYKIVAVSGFTQNVVSEIQLLSAADQITFTTPPPAGSVITADYTVDYIPKDEFHVLDLQAAIQFGEVI